LKTSVKELQISAINYRYLQMRIKCDKSSAVAEMGDYLAAIDMG